MDDVARVVALLGKNSFLAKVDIKSAYRMVPRGQNVVRHGVARVCICYLLGYDQPQEFLQPWQMPSGGELNVGVSLSYYTIWMTTSPLEHQDPRSVLQMWQPF